MTADAANTVKAKAQNQITEAFSMIFDSGKNSDFVVKCGDRVWHLHRAIVCASSEYFSKLCDENFKEGLERVVNLGDIKSEDPADHEDPEIVGIMLRFFYTHDYNFARTSDETSLAAHAHVYAIADRYNVPLLKDLSKEKFQALLNNIDQKAWNGPSFLVAVEIVYTTTLYSDKGLRDCLMRPLKNWQSQLRSSSDFVSLFKTLGDGDFALDVLDLWTGHRRL